MGYQSKNVRPAETWKVLGVGSLSFLWLLWGILYPPSPEAHICPPDGERHVTKPYLLSHLAVNQLAGREWHHTRSYAPTEAAQSRRPAQLIHRMIYGEVCYSAKKLIAMSSNPTVRITHLGSDCDGKPWYWRPDGKTFPPTEAQHVPQWKGPAQMPYLLWNILWLWALSWASSCSV